MKKMMQIVGILAAIFLGASATHAATITMTANDSGGTYSFISAGKWSSGLAPAVGNDYESNGYLIEYSGTVPSGGYTFAGDSLTLKNGARFHSGLETLGGGRWLTINNLTLDGGTISHGRGGGNPITMTGSMTIGAGGATMYATSDSLTWAGSVTGGGPLAITQGSVSFTGAQSYTGNVTISSGATFSAAPSGALVNNGTMIFNHADTRSFNAANYSGTGSVIKRGAGTMNASGAWNIAGNLQIGYGQVSNAGSVVLASGSSLSVGGGSSHNFYVGVGTGTNASNGPTGTLDASAATGVNANVNEFKVGGSVGGYGYLYLGANNVITAASNFSVNHGTWGFPNGYGKVTTAAGGTTTINTPLLRVGHTTPNGTTGGYGEFMLGNGATLNVAGIGVGGRTAMEVGIHNSGNGATHGTSVIDLSGSGTGVANLKLSSLVLGDLQGGNSNGVTGNLILSANAANHLDISGTSGALAVVQIGRSRAGATGSGTLTIGHLGANSQIVSEDNGTAILLARKDSTGAANGTLNLGGGTLTITTTGSAIAGGGGTSNLNLNGTTLKAGASSAGWIQGLTSAKIQSGGVTFDTNGYDIGVSQALLEDAGSTGGGLTKQGAGTLTLSGANTYTGATVINGGTLAIGATAAIGSSSSISIGAGTLQYNNSTTALGLAPTFTGTGGTLGGTGGITPAVTITGGNTLAPGGPSGGTLTLSGGLTLQDNTTVVVTQPGSSLAQVNNDYTDSLGAHSLLVAGTPSLNQSYSFLQWTGSSGVSNGAQGNWTIAPTIQGVTANWIGTNLMDSWNTSSSWMVVNGYSGAVIADTMAKTLSFTLTGYTGSNTTPTSINDVAIDPATSGVSITGPSSAFAVNSLRVGGTNNSSPAFALGSGDLTVATSVNVVNSSHFSATNGALIAPTMNVSGAGAGATLGHASGNITTANVSAGSLTMTAGNITTANISGGTATVNGGALGTANLSGTGTLAGSQAVPQVNVTGGTPGFSGNATVMTVTGGGINSTGGTIGTFHHNTGADTSTIGALTTVTTANVNAGTVNFNSTQANGTLTLTGGAVVVGAGAAVGTADFSAGAGTVTANNALAIANELKLAGNLTAKASGSSFTVQSVAGSNIADNSAHRTLTLSGGTLTLSVKGLSVAPGISYVQITNDADSGISSDRTFTHAIDWGSSGAATVNGVAFATDMNQSVGGRSNSGTRTYGPTAHAGNTPPAVSGSVASIFQDMRYDGPDGGHIELTGLTAGQWYDVRTYDRAWDYGGSVRTFYNLYDVGSNGSVEFTTPKIDQNRANLTPPGLVGNVSWATSYIYQADSTGKLKVTIDLAPDQNGTYHLYGLTNQLLPVKPSNLNLPNTHIAATGGVASTLDLGETGTPSQFHKLGGLILTAGTADSSNDTQLQIENGMNINLNGITATNPTGGSEARTASIVNGATSPVLSLASGSSIDVDSNVTLTIGATIGNPETGTTSLTKVGAGSLILSEANTYTGDTTIEAGRLMLTGSIAGNLNVGAAGALSGNGTIGGDLHFANGSLLAFDSALTVNGAVALGNLSVADVWGLDGSNAAFADASLDNRLTYTLIAGTITDWGTVQTGEESAVSIGGGKSAYFQSGSLQLVIIPEPATLSMIGVVGIALLLRRRIVRG